MSASVPAHPVVVDTDVLLSFYLPGEPYEPQAKALLRAADAGGWTLCVPTLARFEAISVLTKVVRGQRAAGSPMLTVSDAKMTLRAIDASGLAEFAPHPFQERMLDVASKYGLSAYDAAYVALAEWLRADCYTGDQPFVRRIAADFPFVKFVGDFAA